MARLSCGIQCTRTFLFILNILFVILGFILLGFGIYVNVSKKLDLALSEHITTKVLGDGIYYVGIIMIIIAVLTILFASFGCLGAVLKNRVFLYLYAVVLGFLIIVELAAFIAVLSYRVRIRDSYYSGFDEYFIEIYNNNDTDLQSFMEDIEMDFKCCGVYNVTDYYQNNFTVPASCHKDQDFNKPIFHRGCAHATMNWFWDQISIVGGVLGGTLLIEIFGVISSIALGIAISHSSYDYL